MSCSGAVTLGEIADRLLMLESPARDVIVAVGLTSPG